MDMQHIPFTVNHLHFIYNEQYPLLPGMIYRFNQRDFWVSPFNGQGIYEELLELVTNPDALNNLKSFSADLIWGVRGTVLNKKSAKHLIYSECIDSIILKMKARNLVGMPLIDESEIPREYLKKWGWI
jgi:hypothetical protein